MKPISLTGFMGCGKTSAGRELARLLDAGFTDLDELICSREGRSIPDIFRDGEKAFREAELSALLWLLDRASGPMVIALGGGTLTMEEARKAVLERTRCVWLRTGIETIMERLSDDGGSRPLAGDALRLFREREPLYAMAEFVVDTGTLTPLEVALKVAELPGLR